MSTCTRKLVAIAMIRPTSSRLEPRTCRLEALEPLDCVGAEAAGWGEGAADEVESAGAARSRSSLMLVGSMQRDAARTLLGRPAVTRGTLVSQRGVHDTMRD